MANHLIPTNREHVRVIYHDKPGCAIVLGNLPFGNVNLHLLNQAVTLFPDKYSKNPHKDLAVAYKVFKQRIGVQKLSEFDYEVIYL